MATSIAEAHSPLAFSLAQIPHLQRRRARLVRLRNAFDKKLDHLGTLRLAIGALYALALGFGAARPLLHVNLISSAILVPVFIALVLRTRSFRRFRETLDRYEHFLARQTERCSGRPHFGHRLNSTASSPANLPTNPQKPSTITEISGDLRDLGFGGANSAVGLFDETLTDSGHSLLISRLNSVPHREEILRRQNETKRLRGETWFYTKLCVQADTADFSLSTSEIAKFLILPFVPEWYSLAFFSLLTAWVLGIFAITFLHAPAPYLVIAFFLANSFLLGQVGHIFKKGVGLGEHLDRLQPIFGAIEKRTQQSSILREVCPAIHRAGPSQSSRRLTRALTILGVESNPLVQILANVFTPWIAVGNYLLERERRKIAAAFPDTLQDLSHLEVIGSMLLLYRYQTRTFPTLDSPRLQTTRAFHPLLARDRAVANDFAFTNQHSLALLTGSNMSGKSTFLRALGVNQVLANAGATVFADRFATQPMAVGACIEVSDSLRDGFSYFYAEVRRLKNILNTAEQNQPYLFLIDEIFRGTNNRERQIGSRAVIHELAHANNAQGFITTHDLELTLLSETEPSLVNLHFREEIEGGRMIFPYRLHSGPCPTTNALRIMQMEGIPVEF